MIGAGLIAAGSILVHTARSPGVSAFQSVFSVTGIASIIIVVGIITFLIAVFAIVAGLTKKRVLLGIVSTCSHVIIMAWVKPLMG